LDWKLARWKLKSANEFVKVLLTLRFYVTFAKCRAPMKLKKKILCFENVMLGNPLVHDIIHKLLEAPI